MKTDPALPQPFRTSKTGVFVVVTVKTQVTEGAFSISADHFELVAPGGKTFRPSDNGAYHSDHFRDMDGNSGPPGDQGTASPGSGVLLYEVPAGNVPHGWRIQAELYKGQTFGWEL